MDANDGAGARADDNNRCIRRWCRTARRQPSRTFSPRRTRPWPRTPQQWPRTTATLCPTRPSAAAVTVALWKTDGWTRRIRLRLRRRRPLPTISNGATVIVGGGCDGVAAGVGVVVAGDARPPPLRCICPPGCVVAAVVAAGAGGFVARDVADGVAAITIRPTWTTSRRRRPRYRRPRCSAVNDGACDAASDRDRRLDDFRCCDPHCSDGRACGGGVTTSDVSRVVVARHAVDGACRRRNPNPRRRPTTSVRPRSPSVFGCDGVGILTNDDDGDDGPPRSEWTTRTPTTAVARTTTVFCPTSRWTLCPNGVDGDDGPHRRRAGVGCRVDVG